MLHTRPSTADSDSHHHHQPLATEHHTNPAKTPSQSHNSYPPSKLSGSYSSQASADLTSLLQGVDLTLLDSKLIGLGFVREDLVTDLCNKAVEQLVQEGVQR